MRRQKRGEEVSDDEEEGDDILYDRILTENKELSNKLDKSPKK